MQIAKEVVDCSLTLVRDGRQVAEAPISRFEVLTQLKHGFHLTLNAEFNPTEDDEFNYLWVRSPSKEVIVVQPYYRMCKMDAGRMLNIRTIICVPQSDSESLTLEYIQRYTDALNRLRSF